MIGRTVAHFQILEKVGEGGMGVVYKAEDTFLRRVVALKFLTEKADANPDLRARFQREAQAAAALEHENICAVYEMGEEDGHLFLVMAYVEGQPLHQKLGLGPAPLQEAVRIAIQVGEGLRSAHQKGIVHRDIKAENIIVTRDGLAKITDFGLALIRDRSRLTLPGTLMGTVTHMSPEQALAKSVDRRTDIWSLGVVLYQMTTGRLPFHGPNAQVTMQSILKNSPEPLKEIQRPMRDELDRIIGKALAKDPAERYQHVDDMVVDLRALLIKVPGRVPVGPQRKTVQSSKPKDPEETVTHISADLRGPAAEMHKEPALSRKVLMWLLAIAALILAVVGYFLLR